MEKLKVKINRNTKIRKFKELPRNEQETQRFKRVKQMECPCCGKMMYLEDGVWRCESCAYCITQKEMLNGTIFWFCDECGRFMNVQPNFATTTGAWKCVSCGCVNDVSEENMI